MKYISSLAGRIGAGAVLISLFAAATFLRKPDVVTNWLMRETNQARSRQNLQRAETLARASLDHLDAFRVAGL